MKKSRWIICTMLFLGFLCFHGLSNAQHVSDAVKKVFAQGSSFKETVSAVGDELMDQFEAKNLFLDINGFYSRLSGHRWSNERILLNNGYLTHDEVKRVDAASLAEKMSQYNEFLNQNGIEYLYVQAPYKLDLEKTVLPIGFNHNAHENADEMIQTLQKNHVDVLDLRPVLNQDEQALTMYFNKTDHHWNADGAFVGFGLLMEKLNQMFPESGIDIHLASDTMWKRTVYENQFMGSHGKRVGRTFAGVDDLIVYEPAFETEMTSYEHKSKQTLEGSYQQVILHDEYLLKPDYYEENAYYVYLGGNYPMIEHRNSQASSNLKVLLIKDSFALPVQAFLSTVFQEMDVIDARYYSEMTLSEVALANEYDLVIMFINPTVFVEEEYFEYGLE